MKRTSENACTLYSKKKLKIVLSCVRTKGQFAFKVTFYSFLDTYIWVIFPKNPIITKSTIFYCDFRHNLVVKKRFLISCYNSRLRLVICCRVNQEAVICLVKKYQNKTIITIFFYLCMKKWLKTINFLTPHFFYPAPFSDYLLCLPL